MQIGYSKQSIDEKDIQAVNEVLSSSFLTQGPKVAEFEKAFSEHVKSKYAVACSNGTTALHLAILALKNSNKKVLCSTITFAASANCALYEGLEVDFVDIDPRTYLMSPKKLEEHLEKNPNSYQGLVVVDFAGLPCPLHEIRRVCDKYGLWILEDACHAPGGYYKSDDIEFYCGDGKYADVSIFSFHPVKHICCGEGGMATTSNKELYEKMNLLRTHGITKDPARLTTNSMPEWYYEMQELGYNYRLSDINAALGITQLAKQKEGLKRRQEIANYYDEHLADHIKRPYRALEHFHAFHLYVIQVENRDELYTSLKEHGIYTQVHYIPVYRQPYYQSLGFNASDYPNSESYFKKCLSIPMYPTLTDEEQSYVVKHINQLAK